MRVLLDESLPVRLADKLSGHHVSTVRDEGWSGKKNGELMKLATSQFDVFITADQNLQYQINLIKTPIPVIVLAGKTNRFDDLKPLLPGILSALKNLRHGVIRIP